MIKSMLSKVPFGWKYYALHILTGRAPKQIGDEAFLVVDDFGDLVIGCQP